MDEYSFDSVCQLGTVNSAVTAMGDADDQPVFGNDVFCCEKSVGYKEIQAGAAKEFRPDMMLVMPYDAYNLERYVKYNDVIYKVVNTYKNGWNIELTLERD